MFGTWCGGLLCGIAGCDLARLFTPPPPPPKNWHRVDMGSVGGVCRVVVPVVSVSVACGRLCVWWWVRVVGVVWCSLLLTFPAGLK